MVDTTVEGNTMFLPNDIIRPITRFVLGDRLVIADGKVGELQRIIYRTEQPAEYEVVWADGTESTIRYEDIKGVESDDGVQLPLW